MNFSALFIHRPVATTLLDRGAGAGGRYRLSFLAGLAPAAGGLPHHSGAGDGCRARARRPWPPPWQHRWNASSAASPGITEMTSSSSLGSTAIVVAVRPEPQHRRRGARRAGGDQRRARPTAGQPAEQSLLSKSQSRRRADADARADLRLCRASPHVRHGVVDPAAETVAGRRRRRSRRRRRRPAGGAGGRQSHRLESLRARSRRSCARC